MSSTAAFHDRNECLKKDFEQTEKARCRHAAARRDVNGLDVQTV